MPRSAVVGMLLPGIVPFNIIKCTLNAACAMLIYKPLVNALRNTQFVPQSRTSEGLTKMWELSVHLLLYQLQF